MKKLITIFLLVGVFSCIEAPEVIPVDDASSLAELVIPDGFNYETSTEHNLRWKINNLPADEPVLGQVYVEGILFNSIVLSQADTITTIDIPIQYKAVEMIVKTGSGMYSEKFNKDQSLSITVDMPAVVEGNVAMKKSKDDADGDGVEDQFDWAPEDPNISQANFIPAFETFNTIGFEDTWPSNGDYDFNDFVVSFNMALLMNEKSELSTIETKFKVKSIGAGYNNDFCYAIETPSKKLTIEVNNPDVKYELLEYDEMTEIRFVSIKNSFGTKGFVNTVEGDPEFDDLEFTVKVVLDKPKKIKNDKMSYDLFLRIDGEEGREVHMPGKQPSSKANELYFGTLDDDSNKSEGKFYLNKKNLPWAILIPDAWEYPLERENILGAYPDFAKYAQNEPSFPWFSEADGAKKVKTKIYRKKK